MKLNPEQAWHLQWVAAAYPGAFREALLERAREAQQ